MSIGDKLYSNFCNTVNEYKLLDNIDRLVYLFSGGKDATIGIDFLQRYIIENSVKIPLDVVMVTYPKHVYFTEDGNPAECYTSTVEYWKKRGITITAFVPGADDFAEGEPDACAVCKFIRKSFVDPYLENLQKNNLGKKIGVVTGYTLYDVLAYMDEILLVTDFRSNNLFEDDPKIKNRVLNCLHKMKAREELPNKLVVIRPLINMHENMIMDYITSLEIPYVNRSCNASKDKHKREYFKTLNVAAPINHADYTGLLNFLKTIDIELPEFFDDISMSNYFTDC